MKTVRISKVSRLQKRLDPGMLLKGITRRHSAKMPMVVGRVVLFGLLCGRSGQGGGGFESAYHITHYKHPNFSDKTRV